MCLHRACHFPNYTNYSGENWHRGCCSPDKRFVVMVMDERSERVNPQRQWALLDTQLKLYYPISDAQDYQLRCGNIYWIPPLAA